MAFEFNGAQHYGATAAVSQAQADAQRTRDLIKAGLCLYEGILLILIHEEDLSLQAMIDRLDGRLPMRDLADHEPVIDLLERASLSYQAVANRARRLAR